MAATTKLVSSYTASGTRHNHNHHNSASFPRLFPPPNPLPPPLPLPFPSLPSPFRDDVQWWLDDNRKWAVQDSWRELLSRIMPQLGGVWRNAMRWLIADSAVTRPWLGADRPSGRWFTPPALKSRIQTKSRKRRAARTTLLEHAE